MLSQRRELLTRSRASANEADADLSARAKAELEHTMRGHDFMPEKSAEAFRELDDHHDAEKVDERSRPRTKTSREVVDKQASLYLSANDSA